MDINRKNPDIWKADIERSVSFYNKWFVDYAPPTFRESRKEAVVLVNEAFGKFGSMCDLDDEVLVKSPTILPVLRQMTCPPLASDRLAGLARVAPSVVKSFESGKSKKATRGEYASKIMDVIRDLLDTDLFSWIDDSGSPTPEQKKLAAFVVSDRLCGAMADPLIRNEQEARQIRAITAFLHKKGYVEAKVKRCKEERKRFGAYWPAYHRRTLKHAVVLMAEVFIKSNLKNLRMSLAARWQIGFARTIDVGFGNGIAATRQHWRNQAHRCAPGVRRPIWRRRGIAADA